MTGQESRAIGITSSNITLTQELHIIRAHQLHYSSLIEELRKTVIFVRDTRNHAMEAEQFLDIRDYNADLMGRECENLLSEINRLEMSLRMQDRRMKNVMHLVSAFHYAPSQLTYILFIGIQQGQY